MKKLLSIALAVAMIMSLFCVVPAYALEYAEFNLPYAVADFEDGKTIFIGSDAYASEIVDSGDAARGKVAQITVSGNVNGGPSMYSQDGHITAPLEIGDKITISMWIKSNQVLGSANFSIIMTGMTDKIEEGGKLNGNGYHSWAVPFDKNSTEWQYVTQTFTSTFTTIDETTIFTYRMGTTGGLNFVSGETKDSETITDRTYQIDDFSFVIEKGNQTTEKTYPYKEIVSVASVDGSSWDGITTTGASADTKTVATETVTIPATEEGGEATTETNTFLRYTHNATAPIWLKIELEENMKAGHTYILSFKNRVLGLPLADGTLDPAGPSGGTGFSYVNYQIRYPISDANEVTAWGSNSDTDRYSSGKPYMDARWNGANKAATDYANWTTITRAFHSTKQNIEEDLSSDNVIEMGVWLHNQNGSNLGTFDFDDIVVYDLGPVTNGGFDDPTVVSGLFNGGSTNTYIGASRKIAGWHFPGQHGSTQGIGGSARIHTEQQDDKAALLYYQASDESEVYQYVPVYAGEKYQIKGYVRGAKSNEVYTKGRARLVADFTGDTLDQEVYDVLSLGENGVIYGDWVEFDGGYDMENPVSITIDLTNIGIIADRVETAGIMPKSPKVYIDFDEEWEGNVNAPNGGYHAVYMDAFTMKRFASAGYPTVVAESAVMNPDDGVVAATYAYSVDGNVAEATDASVYRLVAGNRYYGTFYDKNAIVVSDAARAAEGLSLEIIPVSATGYIGEAVTVAIEVEEAEVVETTFTATAAAGATLTSAEAMSGEVIWTAYDTNGKMIDWATENIAVDPTVSTTANAPVPAEFDATGATTVKVMLWNNWSECKALFNAITY